jgi:uncharacterized UPF0160 family protein
MQNQQQNRSFGTHDGTFHADEVTACALLLLTNLIDIDKIIRTRDRALLDRLEYVCDVGGVYDPRQKRFDHHQSEYTGPLSSAGMVLEYLRYTKHLPQHEAEFLNNSLVRGIDAHDNGKDPQIPGYCLFSHVISNFNPVHYEASAEELYNAFMSAVSFVLVQLRQSLDRFRYNQSSRGEVQRVMNLNKDLLIFDTQIPWIDTFFELGGERHPATFVIMPVTGGWKLRGIPPTNDDRMRVRIPLPAAWAGLMDEELERVSGIPGAIFCHKGRFISMWKTKEAALAAVQQVLKD